MSEQTVECYIGELRSPTPNVIDYHAKAVMAAPSRKSCMEGIKKACGDGEHIALYLEGTYLWSDLHASIRASNLLMFWEERWKNNTEGMQAIIGELCPDLAGIPLDELDYRLIGNSPGAAVRQEIHAHVLIAKKTTWASGVIPRVVDPLIPVLPEKK